MIRGADKEIRDNRGDTPLDIVKNGEVETNHLANDLRKMLVSFSFLLPLVKLYFGLG